MYAVHKGLCLFALTHFTYVLGHLLVSQQHEFLDELVGLFRHVQVHAYGLAGLVDVKFNFLAVECHRTVGKTLLAYALSQVVELEYLVGKVALAGLNHLLRVFVGKAAVAAYHGVAYVVVQQFGVVGNLEYHRECQLLLVGAK